MARLAARLLMHAVFKDIARILYITGDFMFPVVPLTNCLECVLGCTLQKYCACQRECRSTAPASKILLGTKSCASGCMLLVWCPQPLSFTQLFTLSVASVRPLRMPSRRYPFSAQSTRERTGVLTTNAAYGVSVITRLRWRTLDRGCSDGGISIVDAFRNPTLPGSGWQRWGTLDRGCFLKVGIHGCFRYWIPDVLGTRKIPIGVHGCLCYSIAKRGQRRRSPGARRHRREIITNLMLTHI